MQRDLTTNEAAKICRLSQQTIIRCFDKGFLKGYKVPGSRFRRIPLKSLQKFMEEHGMPMEWFYELYPELKEETAQPAKQNGQQVQ